MVLGKASAVGFWLMLLTPEAWQAALPRTTVASLQGEQMNQVLVQHLLFLSPLDLWPQRRENGDRYRPVRIRRGSGTRAVEGRERERKVSQEAVGGVLCFARPARWLLVALWGLNGLQALPTASPNRLKICFPSDSLLSKWDLEFFLPLPLPFFLKLILW